jgi:hypothetical protein
LPIFITRIKKNDHNVSTNEGLEIREFYRDGIEAYKQRWKLMGSPQPLLRCHFGLKELKMDFNFLEEKTKIFQTIQEAKE